jgi:alkylation response protein AidB-like acyl-CoA dehydrogenase
MTARADETRVHELVAQLLAECAPADPVQFLGRRFDFGLAWVHFPVGRGGLGLAPGLQPVVENALAAAGAPSPGTRNPIGVGMAAPTLLAFASAEQLDRHLRPLFTGEEVWCQLFSEPGAGSDVAGLATRAVRDGDAWIVNGQKVWTSLAHVSRFGLLLTRTDPDVLKHRGMTYFVVDMHAPGVEVRPLVQMTGDAEFNEVYFTDVHISDAERLGDVGDGWRVAITTLMNERVAIGGAVPPRDGGAIGAALEVWRQQALDDPALKDELVRWWVEAEALRLTNIRSAQSRSAGVPGPDGSIGKMVSAELNKAIYAFAAELMGMDGALFPDGYALGRGEGAPSSERSVQHRALRSLANSIEGGTTEVMRNILAERVLGLPPDVRVDKDVPWSAVPRS